MAELNTGDSGGGHKKGSKKPHAKKQSTRIDMTPMVDLAFLLLTFFMLTTTFNKPQRMDISMPVPPDEKNEPTKVKENTVTILIGKDNKLFWYEGEFKNDPTQINKTNYSKNGIRKTLIEKNKTTYDLVSKFEEEYKKKIEAAKDEDKPKIEQELKDTINSIKKDKKNDAVFCIIKAVEESKYENVVNILDEMTICSMLNFALVDITEQEKKLIETL